VYLTHSTVTIVLLGGCTWARKFVDWELSSSLRNDTANRRSGLLAIPLPSRDNTATLPDRVGDNWGQGDESESYACFRAYPASTARLRDDIEDAFAARTSKSDKVQQPRPANVQRQLLTSDAHACRVPAVPAGHHRRSLCNSLV
jgi:hypothetical protein